VQSRIFVCEAMTPIICPAFGAPLLMRSALSALDANYCMKWFWRQPNIFNCTNGRLQSSLRNPSNIFNYLLRSKDVVFNNNGLFLYLKLFLKSN